MIISTLIKRRRKNLINFMRNYLLKLESPSPKPRMLCAKFGWNWLSGSGEEDFLIFSMYFHYFVIISPWKRAEHFIWKNLNTLHPRMLCAKFSWNWISGFRRRFLNFLNVFSPFRNYLALEKGGAFHLIIIESRYPRMLCAKFNWNWISVQEKKILKFRQFIFAFS